MIERLVILDRDGVINVDSAHYIKTPAEWRALPGSVQAIADLKTHGFIVAVATNQSGIARRLYDVATLGLIHDKMQRTLQRCGGKIDLLRYCPHVPEDHCDCRKPRPGLLQQISHHYQVDLRDVPLVGDSLRDLQAAQAVGAQPILVQTGKGQQTLQQSVRDLPDNTKVYKDLAAVVRDLILGNVSY